MTVAADGSETRLGSTGAAHGGADRIVGHAGDDYIFGGVADDFVFADEGNDFV